MAERRMFAKTIIDSDAFIDMPVTSRLLYYDLAMRADDDGFVNSPKKIMRMIGASQDDLSVLITKKFIIPFDNGVVVIKHWRIHNYIQKDRYKPTKYEEEKSMLTLKENGAYSLDTTCIQNGYTSDTQVRLGKDRLGKDNKRFVPPTLDEVTDYCNERHNKVDAERFIDFYSAKGWMVGKNKMKDWKACIRTWEKRESAGKEVLPKYMTEVKEKKTSDESTLNALKEEIERLRK